MDKKILSNLKPEKVFEYFEAISAIPRGSGKCSAVSAYCEAFAKEHGLFCIRDGADNVIIKKAATAGYECKPSVILQGHLDMVWEKNAESAINFETDGLTLVVDGDFVRADGTTLGGDDGIAVAMFLALLDSDNIPHPELEVVLTTDEETGMNGAFALDASNLKSKLMINLDSEEEGTLWVSCAGGARVDITVPCNRVSPEGMACEIAVSGLHGGHSGAEIHVGYANANILMGRILGKLKEKFDFSIAEISGGTMDNAITRDSKCVVYLRSDYDEFSNAVLELQTELREEFSAVDSALTVNAACVDYAENAFSEESTVNLIAVLNALPNGVIKMSESIEGLVQTSLNLGVVKMIDGAVSLTFSVRSSVDGEKAELIEKLFAIASDAGASADAHSEYPAWPYKEDSVLRDKMAEIYKEMFNKDMTVTAIHAGLECGLFCGKIEGLDCVSLGPDMFDIHTPAERLCISSTERVWNYLLEVLKRL